MEITRSNLSDKNSFTGEKTQRNRCFVWVCYFICGTVCFFVYMRLCTDNHLFENHKLIQEVNTLAGEELPDGLLSLEALRVSGGAHLGRLVLQELCQRVVLQKRRHQTGRKN